MKLKLESADEKMNKEKKYSESSNFSDILQATSKYYFEKSVADVYKRHIIYHNTYIYTNKTEQNEAIGFFRTDSDFMKTIEKDWLSILNELRDKFNSRKQLWSKIAGNKKEIELGDDFNLFYLLFMLNIEEIYVNKLANFLEQELNVKFKDCDDNIKISDSIFIINKGEPWIKLTCINNCITSDKVEKFINNQIDDINKEFEEFIKKSETQAKLTERMKTGNFELYFKKLYPYENTRNDIANILIYKQKDKKEEIPLFGIIYSTVGE